MSQILINLAVNARDAMPGGGTLTLSTRTAVPTHPGRLGRGWPDSAKVHLLSVSDTGSGMDAFLHARIFDPFFTTKPMGRGTGLGLSVVEGIVEQSGGDLWVESAPHRGSVFTIALPAVPEPVKSTPLPSQRAEPEARERGVILVVDDEELVRRTFVRALSGAGFHVYEAESGAKALELLDGMAVLPKLLLTDVAMPGMSGTELARRVREIDPAICVILVSGHSFEVVSKEGALPAESTFLEKPFSPDELIRRVHQALEEALSRRARSA
ncbi:MAG: response regulator [Polyangiaceae bacterium]|nr:response regulator [Polyangiaceae bacterium]